MAVELSKVVYDMSLLFSASKVRRRDLHREGLISRHFDSMLYSAKINDACHAVLFLALVKINIRVHIASVELTVVLQKWQTDIRVRFRIPSSSDSSNILTNSSSGRLPMPIPDIGV